MDSILLWTRVSLQIKSISHNVFKGILLEHLTTHLTKVLGLLLLPDKWDSDMHSDQKVLLNLKQYFLPEVNTSFPAYYL